MPFIFKIPSGSQSYKSTILADTPIAYWRLGELSGTNANDEIGGSNGTYVNTPTLGAVGLIANDSNAAVSFNRTTLEYVSIPDDNKFTFTNGTNDLPFSVEAWVSVSNFTTQNPFFTKTLGSGNAEEYLFQVKVDGRIQGVIYDQLSNNNHFWNSNPGIILLNIPAHIVIIYGGSINSGEIYVNGNSISTTTGNTGSYVRMRNTTTKPEIGSRLRNDGINKSYFDGTIDEVAIYNYALTPTQVLAHYQAGT